MRNPITGHRTVEIDGQELTLRYTWKAIAEVEAKYGDAPNLFDPETVANVAAAGLRDTHPEYTPERILELSPPFIPFVKAIQDALQIAYFGAIATPEGGDTVKKNRLTGGWLRLIKWLLPRG